MRRIAVVAGTSLASLVSLAAPAEATFHLNKVNEVMLASGSGDASVQFVEFLDRGGSEEAFTPVFAPYKLVVYDAAANKVGEHMLDPAGLRSAAAVGAPYLVSTAAADAALYVKGDERLDVGLPLSAGQACFEANPSPPAFNCLTWGTITKAVPTNSMGTGSANGPVPPNGESDQRQANDSIVAAPPTPKAPNRGATTTTGMPTMTFAGVSFAAATARVDRRGRALVRLRCPMGTNGSCRGRLTLTAARGKARLGNARFSIASSKTASVSVALSRAAQLQLERHGKLRVRATAVSHDATGASMTTASRLTLVGRPHHTK